VNGLRTDIATTDERGRVSVRALQLNPTRGWFAIRMIASKEQARAGTVSFQYIAGPTPTALQAPLFAGHLNSRRGRIEGMAHKSRAGLEPWT